MWSKIKKEFSLIIFSLCFLGLLIFLLHISPTNQIKEETSIQQKTSYFHGYTRIFQAKDLWWLSPKKWRNPDNVLQFLQNRSLSLHYIFKKHNRKYKRKNKNEFLGIYMEISESGKFENVMPAFTNTKNALLAKDIAEHIQEYWHYTKAKGRDKFILLIRFDVKQPPILWHNVQSK